MKLILANLAVVSSLLGGCAAFPEQKAADLDNHRFDGQWVVEMQKTARDQRANSQALVCEDRAGELQMTVSESVATLSLFGTPVQASVKASGEFELFQDIAAATSNAEGVAVGVSTATHHTWIVSGELDQASLSGRLVEYVADLNGGCRTRIAFRKSSA